MKKTHLLVILAGIALGLVAAFTDVQLFPDLVVGALPLLFVVILLSFGGVARIKRPAWLTLTAAFGLWGAAAGFRADTGGHFLCGAIFGAIGCALGIEVETYRSKRRIGSPARD